MVDIRKVFDDHRGRYGAPRIYRVMCELHGYTGSLNRIQTLMRAMGLRAKAAKKFKVTTDSAHALPIAPNLLGQDFSCDPSPASTAHAKAPDQVWLSDITTYGPVKAGCMCARCWICLPAGLSAGPWPST